MTNGPTILDWAEVAAERKVEIDHLREVRDLAIIQADNDRMEIDELRGLLRDCKVKIDLYRTAWGPEYLGGVEYSVLAKRIAAALAGTADQTILGMAQAAKATTGSASGTVEPVAREIVAKETAGPTDAPLARFDSSVPSIAAAQPTVSHQLLHEAGPFFGLHHPGCTENECHPDCTTDNQSVEVRDV